MATKQQSEFLKDLALRKFQTFPEFKKWLATTGIVRTNGQIFKQSMNMVQILNRVSVSQASSIITQMESLQDMQYKTAYEQGQIDEVNSLINEIKEEVESWTFSV